MPPDAELTKALQNARIALLVTGLIMFASELIIGYVVAGDHLTDSGKNGVLMIAFGELAVFLALWWLAKRTPTLCIGIGLAIFVGAVLCRASIEPKTLTPGISMKVVIIMTLVKGLTSAGRTEVRRDELGQVVE